MRILFLGCFVFLMGCVSPSYYQTNKKVMDAYYTNQFDLALKELEKNKYLHQPYNNVLLKLEKARLLYLNNQFSDAAKLLIESEITLEDDGKKYYRDMMGNRIYMADNRYTIDGRPLPPPPKNMDEALDQSSYVRGSVGKATVVSFKSAAKTTYLSTDIERPLVNYQLGLCGLALGDDKPLTEAKLLYALYDKFNVRKIPVSDASYSPNPFLNVCSGIFFEAANEVNSAFIAYELALKSYNDSNCLLNYGVQLPLQLKKDLIAMSLQLGFTDRAERYQKQFGLPLEKPKNKEVLLLIELNHTPRKNVTKIILNKPPSQGMTSTYPYIEKVSATAEHINVTIDKVNYEAPVINNLQYQLGEVVAAGIEKSFNANSKGAVADRYQNYDSRNWQTLPAQICYTRVPFKSGIQQLQISYLVNNKVVQKTITIHMKENDKVIPIRIADE